MNPLRAAAQIEDPATAVETAQLLEDLGAAPAPTAAPTVVAPHDSNDITGRAKELLGKGINAEQVAAALGVVPSRISQLLSDDLFAAEVADLRYIALQSATVRDEKYCSLEDTLLAKLERTIPLMVKPETVMNAIKVVNGATRRGATGHSAAADSSANVVAISLPKVIVNKFTVNVNNQVTRAGEQELITIESGNLMKQLEDIPGVAATIEEASTQQPPASDSLTDPVIGQDSNHDTSSSTDSSTDSLPQASHA